ncbi:hypothetical protein [Scytonema sp. NUACC26]|uniref:hypothetical protein n=1 Tax=Scytonema sp. NUACC26 TaxID=3140176 RepID=UPI0034DC9A2A
MGSIANPIRIRFFDEGVEDGDLIKVELNGKVIQAALLLSNEGTDVNVTLEPGFNLLKITALNEGSIQPNTAALSIDPSQILTGGNVFQGSSSAGGSTFFSLGFPQITISSSQYPESAAHALDAQAKGFPRIVTIDRPNNEKRRRASLRRYRQSGGTPARPGQDLDEYPPAVFLENGGAASVRPVTLGDNRGTGTRIGNQINNYGSTNIKLNDGYKVELVVIP